MQYGFRRCRNAVIIGIIMFMRFQGDLIINTWYKEKCEDLKTFIEDFDKKYKVSATEAEPENSKAWYVTFKTTSVRLLHAKEPGENFRNDFDKYPALWKGLERALCPRIHFKLMISDLQKAYIGSANLTGAALGMKSENRRNFEAGIFTDEEGLTKAAIDQFDEVWMGKPCKACGRKDVCKDLIVWN